MSIFSVIGNIGKSVGKVALGAAGGVLGTATGGLTSGIINANMFDKNPNSGTSPAQVAVPPTTLVNNGNVSTSTSIVGAGFSLANLGSNLSDALGGLGNWLNGRTATQNNVNIGSQPTSSGLPAWLLPVALGLGALYLVTSGGGTSRKRY
jgi:hypothetical protein